ncbi:YHYH protein [bacterium]|nr:YHYH protein [bacterium]QQR58096.1 MAG: YHYH protein [Candidatus Melainabacteria bacterium]
MKFFCLGLLIFALIQTVAILDASPALAHFEHDHQKKVSQKKKVKASKKTIDPWKWLELALEPANAATTNVQIYEQGIFRIIRSNGMPDHSTGAFPNAGNPNTMSEQSYTFRMPLRPKESGSSIEGGMYPFGVAINGVPFDPGANEFWNNNRASGFQYEAMHLGAKLGIDANNAHVQPNGAYHYHGLPTGLINKLSKFTKPVLLGWAADGFPIYGPYAHTQAFNAKSNLQELKSSYRLKKGTRKGGPGGFPDGSFVQDYQFVANAGDLDECNGRRGVTPEFPNGTYYYVITRDYPYIPRRFKAFPDESFKRRGGDPSQRQRPGQGAGQRAGQRPTTGVRPDQDRRPGQDQFRPPGGPQNMDGPPFHQGPPPHDGLPPHGGPPPFGGPQNFGGPPPQGNPPQ